MLSKGQIVIPAELRKKFRIEPGTEVQIMEYGGIIYLFPPVDDPCALPAARSPRNPPSGIGFCLIGRRIPVSEV